MWLYIPFRLFGHELGGYSSYDFQIFLRVEVAEVRDLQACGDCFDEDDC